MQVSPNANNQYVLLVGDDDLAFDIERIALEEVFRGPIQTATTIAQAMAILQQNPFPLLVVAEHSMQNTNATVIDKFLKERESTSQLVVCTGSSTAEIHPLYSVSCKFLKKSHILNPLMEIMQDVMQQAQGQLQEHKPVIASPEYCAVQISNLVRVGIINFDLYVKLSESKFIKILNRDSVFDPRDASKFTAKKISHLYIQAADKKKLLEEFQKNLNQLEQKTDHSTAEKMNHTHEANDLVRNLYQAFGWSDEIQAIAQKSIESAMSVIFQNPQLMDLLLLHTQQKDSYVASHSSTLVYVSCGIARYLDWVSDYSFSKLCVAAYLHDITLTPSQEINIQKLNVEAVGAEDAEGELADYMKHPSKSALVLDNKNNMPPDVDKIIYQHHERPDGRGFPEGLTAKKIHPLAALFIVAEDLVLYLEKCNDVAAGVAKFITTRKEIYHSGHFKKILDAIEENLPAAEAKMAS